jgi:hypothetical protein
MKTHYVYKLENPATKEFYYGSRTCECNPHVDVYMGSMTRWKPNKKKLVKTIVKSDFENRMIATEFEASLIAEHIKNPLNRNYHIPNNGVYGSPKGERTKTHPFVNQKYMKKWCKENGVKCNTQTGSDVDWILHDPFKQKIPKTIERIGILKISTPKYTMGMSRETAI